MLLGRCAQTGRSISPTGVSPTTPDLPRSFGYTTTFSLPEASVAASNTLPQPRPCNPYQVSHTNRFSLIRFRSPLLTESLLFSLPVGTEMFHFPTFPPRTLYIQMRVTAHDDGRVSPFGHPRITVRLPTPRGLSQAPTSFIGS